MTTERQSDEDMDDFQPMKPRPAIALIIVVGVGSVLAFGVTAVYLASMAVTNALTAALG